MSIELKELKRKDFGKAIDFAVTGMHFERYSKNRVLLRIYGRYFLYMELERATQVIAAYEEEKLAGILLAVIRGEEKRYHSAPRALYVKVVKGIMDLFFGDASSEYDDTNRQMLEEYIRKEDPDGEICFLAADPEIQGKGIGSRLLAELERREPGKKIYLFTDDNCTWQFYERRGFRRAGEKDIRMEIEGEEVPLKCLLYGRTMPC